jgi:hypothetical protein
MGARLEGVTRSVRSVVPWAKAHDSVRATYQKRVTVAVIAGIYPEMPMVPCGPGMTGPSASAWSGIAISSGARRWLAVMPINVDEHQVRELPGSYAP